MQYNQEILNIGINNIIPSPILVRSHYDEESINELANSIKSYGIIQPLLVKKIGTNYEIVSGNRRYHAAKKIGLSELPVIVVTSDDNVIKEVLLNENLQKQPLSALDEAASYQKLKDITNLSLAELSKKIGKKESIIESKLNLLTLSPKVQEALQKNNISESHAKMLLQIPNFQQQDEILNKIILERITVKDTDKLIKESLNVNNNKEVENMNENQESQVKSEFDGLLKVEAVPQVAEPTPASQPNPFLEEKSTMFGGKFFPSLEDEKLNMGVQSNPAPVSVDVNAVNPVPTPITPSDMPIAPVELIAPTIPSQVTAVEQPVINLNPTMQGMNGLNNQTINNQPQPIPSLNPIDTAGNAQNINQPVVEPTPVVPITPTPTVSFNNATQPIINNNAEQPATNLGFNAPGAITTPAVPPVGISTANLSEAINSIRTMIISLESKNYRIETQELDLQGEYQFILKIKK